MNGVALRTRLGSLIRPHGLQTRIVIAFVGLLCTLQVAALLTVHVTGTSTSEETLAKELVNGERVFARILDQNAEQLAQAGRILSSDFGFREAVATKDRETMVSALANQGARIKSDLMLLTDLDHHVIADTLRTTMTGHRFALANLLKVAESKGSASAVIHIDGAIYQVVVVPVLAPLPIAWVVMGFRLDNADALDLQRLTGLQVSFLSRNRDGTWKLEGTTLTEALRPALVEAITRLWSDQQRNVTTVTLAGAEFMTLVSSESTAGDGRVIAVLQRPIDDALKPFHQLQRQILVISAFALLLALGCSMFVARGIARPVHRLAAFARGFASGEQMEPIDIRQNDEIGDLALAFDQMRERITDRESRILDLAYRDALTGLPNRVLFSDRLQQAIALARRLGRPLTVVILDLDRFKTVNDSLGHQGGDLLLVEVGKRLMDVIRRQSDTIARHGRRRVRGAAADRGHARRDGRGPQAAAVPRDADDGRRAPGRCAGQLRHRDVPAARRGSRDPAQARRLRDVHRQAQQRRLRGLRPALRPRLARTPVADERAAPGGRARRTGSLLPAEDRPARSRRAGRRVPGALDPCDARLRAARRVHPVRRADRLHLGHHRVGHPPGAGPAARAGATRASTSRCRSTSPRAT